MSNRVKNANIFVLYKRQIYCQKRETVTRKYKNFDKKLFMKEGIDPCY